MPSLTQSVAELESEARRSRAKILRLEAEFAYLVEWPDGERRLVPYGQVYAPGGIDPEGDFGPVPFYLLTDRCA